MTKVKGIILAGGNGTRLKPMTDVISKQLLPIYNKPMIFYPLSLLIQSGIKDILIITKSEEQNNFKKIIGDGERWGVKIDFLTQDKPSGIAEALIIAENWLNRSSSLLILGDNLFFGLGLNVIIKKSIRKKIGATIFGFQVSDPKRYGVVTLSKSGKILSIDEKPKKPRSNWAVTGLYYYDNSASEKAKNLKPSKRGELEITDLNNEYLKDGSLEIELLEKGFAWLDTGTPDALLEASNFVKIIETRQGLLIGDPSKN
ncbi:MAG: glucose-1-phosphate thymidylyltransferase [Flavobacteriaceae bacterium]|nr:glucose-1-phosphate thymidylyltransferase [Flavobacteriaceae bacterium]